jgi:hypothetical protein
MYKSPTVQQCFGPESRGMRPFTLMRIRIRIRLLILMLYRDPDTARHQSDANLHPLGLGTPTSQIVSLHGSWVSLHGCRVSLHGSGVNLCIWFQGEPTWLQDEHPWLQDEHPCMAPLWASTTPGFSLLMRIRIRLFTLMRIRRPKMMRIHAYLDLHYCSTVWMEDWRDAQTSIRLAGHLVRVPY